MYIQADHTRTAFYSRNSLFALTAASALLSLAAALGLARGRLHCALAAGTRGRLAHAVSRLQVLHHRAHSFARTSATRAREFGHYTLA